jgi:hypothetical protein
MSIFGSIYVTDMAVGMVGILYHFHLKNGLVHAMQCNGPLQQVSPCTVNTVCYNSKLWNNIARNICQDFAPLELCKTSCKLWKK